MTKYLIKRTAYLVSLGLTLDYYKAYLKAVKDYEKSHKGITFELKPIFTEQINWLGFGKPPPGITNHKS